MSVHPNNPMLHAALWYAELGYPVFPCAPGRKTPLTEHGLLEASADTERITTWWTQHPDANIAIRTDGLIVIDIDGETNNWLTGEPAKLADLEAAPLSLTPRGGRHYFFRQPGGQAWRNTAGRLAPHVDTRADGGYVLVAPSVVESTPYSWQAEHELNMPPQRLPEPPAWLTKLLDALTAPSDVAPVGAIGNAIPAGQRNATLARLPPAIPGYGHHGADGESLCNVYYHAETGCFSSWQGAAACDGHVCRCSLGDFPACKGEAAWVAVDLNLDGSDRPYRGFPGRDGGLPTYEGRGVPRLRNYDLTLNPATWMHDCPCETWTGAGTCVM